MSLKTLNLLLAIILLHVAQERTLSMVANNLEKLCYLPEGCKFIGKEKWDIDTFILCTDLYTKIDMKTAKEKHETCSPIYNYVRINIIFDDKNSKQILNNSFELHKITDYLGSTTKYNYKFINLKGFDINLALDFKDKSFSYFYIEFYDFDFSFYHSNGTKVVTCEDMIEANKLSSVYINFIFLEFSDYFSATFINTRFPEPICPLLFGNSRLESLVIHHLLDSYYKKNLLQFINSSSYNQSSLNSHINTLELDQFYGLDLDSNLLNRFVFKRTRQFAFDGVIRSIENDVFKPFRHLNSIKFNPKFLLELIRRQGIEWIKRINDDLHINITDPESREAPLIENIYRLVEIEFQIDSYGDFELDNRLDFTYDEDFCLFKDFPFNQLILFNVYIYQVNTSNLSCTTLWLIQYHHIYYQYINSYDNSFWLIKSVEQTLTKLNTTSKNCHFKERLEKCNKSDFKRKKFNSSDFDLMIISQLLLVIFTPLISLFGMVTNLFVIIIVCKKGNQKELKEKQYSYMAINSISNIVILLTQILSLINECHYPFGLFCSSVHRFVFVQYLKIIFVETVNSCFRLISNFSYLAFAITRLSLVGKNKRFVEFFSSLSILKFMIFSVFISSLLSLVKAFRFKINVIDPFENYPFIFYRYTLEAAYLSLKTIYILIFIFDAIYDLVNYILFTLVNILLDVILLTKLKAVMDEKEKKQQTVSSVVANEKKKKENDEAVRRVTQMVVLNAIVNVLCKAPSVIISLNDLRLLIVTQFEKLQLGIDFERPVFEFPYTMKHVCYIEDICVLFQNFGNFLFLISLSTNFFFYYKFDKKFKVQFNSFFLSRLSKTSLSKNNSQIETSRIDTNAVL